MDITSNQISEKGGLLIAECVGLNNLYLSHNRITVACVRKYLELKELKVLDLRFNEINAEEKEELRSVKGEQLQMFL